MPNWLIMFKISYFVYKENKDTWIKWNEWHALSKHDVDNRKGFEAETVQQFITEKQPIEHIKLHQKNK